MTETEKSAASSEEGFWANVKKQFAKNRLAVFSVRMLIILASFALLAGFISNEKPLIAEYNGSICFPVFRSILVDAGLGNFPAEFQNKNWREIKFGFAIFPPVPYLPGNIDMNNAGSVGPFDEQSVASMRWRHWLGTDEIGHDVLAGMIHGTRIALTVGLVSMGISALIGIFFGAMAGFFGDDRLKISRAGILLNTIFFFTGLFYVFSVRFFELKDALQNSFIDLVGQILLDVLLMIFILFIGNLAAIPLKKIPWLGKKVMFPADLIVMRLIELLISIPTLFLIISIVAIARPSLYLVMVIIGCTSWTGIAKYLRAELLKVRKLEYIEAAEALGFSSLRTLLRHAIPNALSPVLIALAFGVAGAILIESSLSFLGIGVPAETITWGSLLAASRADTSAWWLAVFPGFAIFITVTFCNLVGEGLTDAMDPRLKK